MMKAQEVKPLDAALQARDPGLLGRQAQPEIGQNRRRPSSGLFGLLAGGAEDDEVVGVANQRPLLRAARRPLLVQDVQSDVASSGEIGETCGVAAPVSDTARPRKPRL